MKYVLKKGIDTVQNNTVTIGPQKDLQTVKIKKTGGLLCYKVRMDENDVIISSTEIVKDRLYFATLKAGYKPKPTRNSKYFHIEDEIVYENFYFDFGPYHLCHLYQFCLRLNEELDKNPRKKIVFFTSDNEALRLNAAYLIGSYQIIYLGASPGAVYKQLTDGSEWSLLNFRDASGGPALFDISLLDVLHGIKVAHEAKFFDFEHFDADQYLFYEKVENGDLNWVVPGKMLAFSGPHHRSRLDRGYPLHSPEHYHEYFRRHNVTTIVRLNKKSYDARQFTAHGFEHRELFFVDGSVPSDLIVNRFIRISEAAKGAVAVHCKAGLGRTGTLIACYMMKHHGFTAREAIAWLRVCRPGSVIGHQQWFLENIQPRMIAEGEAYRRRHNITSLPTFTRGVYCDLPPPTKVEDKPVSLQTILATNKNTNKLDNANALNANISDLENNMSAALKYKGALGKASKPPAKGPAALKAYAAKTSTFPPTRCANSQNAKIASVKPFTGKSSFHGQRANLSRPNAAHAHTHGGSLKGGLGGTRGRAELPSLATALSALTENCHLNGSSRLPDPRPQTKPANNPIRKKSNSISRKKPTKPVPKSNLETEKELSSSDTNVTSISADSLESPFRFRRKREPEPMDCAGDAPVPSADDIDETTDSQGNKLYKIKALRKKCPAFGATAKKDGIQTRSSSTGNSTVKKK
ncbi:hypothetical protein ACJJTC_007446 [Scirpophaga incertulas]